MSQKISIRFYEDHEIYSVWNDKHSEWWFSVLDVIGVLTGEESREKKIVYWKRLQAKMKKDAFDLINTINKFKLTAADGKCYNTDFMGNDGIVYLANSLPNDKASSFLDWFLHSENTIDSQSRNKAYRLFENGMLETIEPGSIQCLQQIHEFLFGGLYDFAGKIRECNISKGGFMFANAFYFPIILRNIENMTETNFNDIINKYTEMNFAHPFMEGNGRSTRIWLDLMLKRTLKKCIDWSKIKKDDYMNAMKESVVDNTSLKILLESALSSKINDMEMFMKGIDYSYYYEI